MPIFMDRHDMVEQSAEETARLHIQDLKIQDQYGVRFLTYWYDAERHTTFCLVDAPDKETADKVHAEAHGYVANEMIEVELSAVEAFLGRVQDPPSAKTTAIDDAARRCNGGGTAESPRCNHPAESGEIWRRGSEASRGRHHGVL